MSVSITPTLLWEVLEHKDCVAFCFWGPLAYIIHSFKEAMVLAHPVPFPGLFC